VHQHDAYTTNAGVQLKLCATRPLFKGNISVADCMLQSINQSINQKGLKWPK